MRVLHVLDADLARGAQRSARMLVDELSSVGSTDSGRVSHRIATIFESDAIVARADIELAIASSAGRRMGLSPAAVAAFRRNNAARSADVIVAHGGESLKYVAAARLPATIVYHKIGVVGAGFDRWASSRFHRWAVQRAAAVVAISGTVAEEARELLGVPPEKIVVIPNARNATEFRPDVRSVGTRQSPSRPTVSFVGRLCRSKRPDVFLDVVALLADRGIAVEAAMAGDGPMMEQIAPRARSLDVRLLGASDSIPGLLAATDVFLFPSEREGEGMPGVLIEASMCGAVPVATDVPGARQVIEHRRTGFVVPAWDPAHALTEYVADLLADPARRQRMATRARARAITNFSADVVAGRWRQLFDEVAPGPVPAGERENLLCA